MRQQAHSIQVKIEKETYNSQRKTWLGSCKASALLKHKSSRASLRHHLHLGNPEHWDLVRISQHLGFLLVLFSFGFVLISNSSRSKTLTSDSEDKESDGHSKTRRKIMSSRVRDEKLELDSDIDTKEKQLLFFLRYSFLESFLLSVLKITLEERGSLSRSWSHRLGIQIAHVRDTIHACGRKLADSIDKVAKSVALWRKHFFSL